MAAVCLRHAKGRRCAWSHVAAFTQRSFYAETTVKNAPVAFSTASNEAAPQLRHLLSIHPPTCRNSYSFYVRPVSLPNHFATAAASKQRWRQQRQGQGPAASAPTFFSTKVAVDGGSQDLSEKDVIDLDGDVDNETEETTPKTRRKAPSILKTLPEGYSPNEALQLLQAQSAGGKLVRLSDFRDLAFSARHGAPRDAKAILRALVDFKRCNSFFVNTNCARVAMFGMSRAMQKDNATPLERVEAALFVLDAFVNEKTGLYFAAKTEYIDIFLNLLLDAVKESGLALAEGFSGVESGAVSDEGDDDEVDRNLEALAKRVLRTQKNVMAALVKRGTRPERKMKKRAARKYRKALRIDDGPLGSTAHVGVQICLELGASAKLARDAVLTPYKAAHFKPKSETEILVLAKKKEEVAAARAAKKEAEELLASEETAAEDGGTDTEEENGASNESEVAEDTPAKKEDQ